MDGAPKTKMGHVTLEFRHDLWHQKTRVLALSCGDIAWSYV